MKQMVNTYSKNIAQLYIANEFGNSKLKVTTVLDDNGCWTGKVIIEACTDGAPVEDEDYVRCIYDPQYRAMWLASRDYVTVLAVARRMFGEWLTDDQLTKVADQASIWCRQDADVTIEGCVRDAVDYFGYCDAVDFADRDNNI